MTKDEFFEIFQEAHETIGHATLADKRVTDKVFETLPSIAKIEVEEVII